MRLEIVRLDGEIDIYDVVNTGIALSPFLETIIPQPNDNESGGEEEDELGEVTIRLPVTFADKYMKVVESYLNYFSRESLPVKITLPITTKETVEVLHPRIFEWLQNFTLDELARLRQVCMFFQLDPLIDEIDATLAIAILSDPKSVFKQFHEANLTLASKESVVEEFPILT